MSTRDHGYAHPLLGESNRAHHRTLHALLVAGARRWPDRVWCQTPEGSCTRHEAYEAGRRVAAGLLRRGVSPGDRVVVALPNGLDFVHVWFGLIFARAVTVAINPKAVHAELPTVVSDVAPSLVVTDEPNQLSSTVPVESVPALLTEEPLTDLPSAQASEDEPVALIQSSGSTGRPKFVIETHRMYTLAAEGFPYWLDLSGDDVMLTTLPLSHINAQVYTLQGSYGVGAQMVLLPRFSATTFWDDVVRYGATQFNAIGAMVEALMSRGVSEAERANTIRLCYSAPTPRLERHQEIEKRFGLRLAMGYALSESPYGLVVPAAEPQVYEVMGTPRQHPTLGAINKARVVRTDGSRAEDDEAGELELHNPAISPGYFGDPEQTEQMTRGGWLRTGDLAKRRADGQFIFCGRTKEIIRYRGENLSPVEVELVLDAHPGVISSAVVGVPSQMSEEDVKAFVLCDPAAVPEVDELSRWCSEQLPPYKRPRYYEFVQAWPLTETHKIAKHRLPRNRTNQELDVRPR